MAVNKLCLFPFSYPLPLMNTFTLSSCPGPNLFMLARIGATVCITSSSSCPAAIVGAPFENKRYISTSSHTNGTPTGHWLEATQTALQSLSRKECPDSSQSEKKTKLWEIGRWSQATAPTPHIHTQSPFAINPEKTALTQWSHIRDCIISWAKTERALLHGRDSIWKLVLVPTMKMKCLEKTTTK